LKVYIGPFVNWIGPYQIAERLCFWAKSEADEYGIKRKPDWVHDFGARLAERKDGSDTLLTKACQWVHQRKQRKVKIRIDRYDSWSADSTLAMIALPLLKQLRDTKHGSQIMDDEDVPEELQLNGFCDWSPQQLLDFGDLEQYKTDSWNLTHRRWAWALDEMIWSFEQIHPDNDWEAQYHTGVIDIQFEPIEGSSNSLMVRGPKDTHVFDAEGHRQHQERIDRGLKLFGKYFQGLWD
jgi:hypothetical protein